MNIKLDLTGLSFEQQRELLLLQKELMEKEENFEYNKEKKRLKAIEEQNKLELLIWEDYLHWISYFNWCMTCRDGMEIFQDTYGSKIKCRADLTPENYALSKYTQFSGYVPKNPNREQNMHDEKIKTIDKHGENIKSGLNNVAKGCKLIAEATVLSGISQNTDHMSMKIIQD